LIFLLAIALLIFGPRKLPELGQGLGKGIRGFKEALRGISDESEESATQTKLDSQVQPLFSSQIRRLGVSQEPK
jgi:sec-independent protein translocase protein TatA